MNWEQKKKKKKSKFEGKKTNPEHQGGGTHGKENNRKVLILKNTIKIEDFLSMK